MKKQKLNAFGFSHIVVPMMVIMLVAVAGVYTLVASHADQCFNPASGPVSPPVSSAMSGPVSAPVCPTTGGVKTVVGFTNIAHDTASNTAIFACKTYINAYGGVYSMKYLFTKPAKLTNASYSLKSSRKGVLYFNRTANAWYNNVVASFTSNMSALSAVGDKQVANVYVNGVAVTGATMSNILVNSKTNFIPANVQACVNK